MPSPTDGLITLDDLKEDLKITVTDHDAKLDRIILAVSQGICDLCGGRTFLATTETAKKLDGDGTVLLLVKFPIISITSITNDTISVVETTNYEQYANLGRIELTDGSVWANGRKKVTITYRHGYAFDDLPPAITRAAFLWAAKMWLDLDNKRHGVTSVTRGDETVSYEKTIPQEVRDLVAPYDIGHAAERWYV